MGNYLLAYSRCHICLFSSNPVYCSFVYLSIKNKISWWLKNYLLGSADISVDCWHHAWVPRILLPEEKRHHKGIPFDVELCCLPTLLRQVQWRKIFAIRELITDNMFGLAASSNDLSREEESKDCQQGKADYFCYMFHVQWLLQKP